jgi:hypothetical protein
MVPPLRNHRDSRNYHTMLRVNRLVLANAGNYRVVVTNGELVEETNFTLVVRTKPEVSGGGFSRREIS